MGPFHQQWHSVGTYTVIGIYKINIIININRTTLLTDDNDDGHHHCRRLEVKRKKKLVKKIKEQNVGSCLRAQRKGRKGCDV